MEALDWLGNSDAMRDPKSPRWAGYISYDLGRLFEPMPSIAADDLSLPLFMFVSTSRAPPGKLPAVSARQRPTLARPAVPRSDYEQAVQAVLDFVAAGDVYQVNLSQRLTAVTAEPGSHIYARLQAQSPASYGALIDCDAFQIISNSPELFFSVQPSGNCRRTILSRPIKGTRPRGEGMFEQLLASEKDAAELAMIVDLQRNDLGKVCEIGSVRVTEPRTIEAHPSIFHGVATIEGALRNDVSLAEILRALFPCGSITGCPKIRAMQIIEHLEPTRRGPYCGAIGYIDADGSMQFSVAIRTMTIIDGTAVVPVGGGIVADSTPAAEYDETIVKAHAMLRALSAKLG